jgi:hypothetical protein
VGQYSAVCAVERNIPDSAVARVAAVLGAFDAQRAELRVSEIARRCGLPKFGHRRIAALAGRINSFRARQRLSGFRAALASRYDRGT